MSDTPGGGPAGPPKFPRESQQESRSRWRHMPRPRLVATGSIIALVLSAAAALGGAAVLVWASSADSEERDQFEETYAGIDFSGDIAAVGITALIWIAVAVFGVAVAVQTLRGHNWARTTMTVFACITMVLALPVMAGTLLGAVWLIGAGLSIIFVYAGRANAWFRYAAQRRMI